MFAFREGRSRSLPVSTANYEEKLKAETTLLYTK
jgi:hypothetical protein